MNDVIVDKIYAEKEDFIIIAVTGRTGAGTTTASNFLCKTFDEMNLSNIGEPLNNEDRKNRVIYKYAEKNWKKFIHIKSNAVITSFILEDDYDVFTTFVASKSSCVKGLSCDELSEKLMSNIKLKDEFESMHKLRSEYKLNFQTQKLNQDELLQNNDVYSFYFELLPEFTQMLRQELKGIDDNLYYELYQLFGRNIRKSGSAYDDTLQHDKFMIMPQRINKYIKILRKRNLTDKTGVRVVIDSLKNPYEISFFRDRYSSFYTFAVHCSNESRIKRLQDNLNLSHEDVEALDKMEYAKKVSIEESVYVQSIQKCYELSDVHIINEHNIPGEKQFDNLLKQLVKNITLIMHPGLVTPSHQERLMNIAFTSKVNSTCISRKVGATVCDSDFSLLSIGWNNAPEGQVGCGLRSLSDLSKEIQLKDFSKYEKNDIDFVDAIKAEEASLSKAIENGRNASFCFKDIYEEITGQKNQVHTRALHAEENAFLQLIKIGAGKLTEGKLFTTASPCVLCSKKAYQLGIKEIYYIDQYPDISEDHILNQGETSPKMIRFSGVIGSAYQKLYHPVLSYKDEMELYK